MKLAILFALFIFQGCASFERDALPPDLDEVPACRERFPRPDHAVGLLYGSIPFVWPF